MGGPGEGRGASSVNPVAPSAKSTGKKNTFYMKLFIPARGSITIILDHRSEGRRRTFSTFLQVLRSSRMFSEAFAF